MRSKQLPFFSSRPKPGPDAADPETVDQARIQALLSSMQKGVLMEDQDRRIAYVNARFLQLFDISQPVEACLGLPCEGLARAEADKFEDAAGFMAGIEACLTPPFNDRKDTLQMKNGRTLERHFSPIRSKGEILGFIWQYEDVTQARKLLSEVQRSEEKYRGIIQNMGLGLMEADARGVIVRADPVFCDLTGYTAQELIGKAANDLFPDAQGREALQRQDADRALGKTGLYQVQIFKKDKTPIWVLVSSAPIYNEAGQFEGSVGIHYDITEIRQMQLELERAKLEAESARDAEKEFLANMSHEIRTPINAILGMANLLYNAPLNPEQRANLDAIKFSSEILQAILSDVLDIAKIQEGKIEVRADEVHLGNLLRATSQTISYRIGDRPVQLETEIAPELDGLFETDKTYLSQILLNLLSNALKFTQQGTIRIALRQQSDAGDLVQAVLVVADTGIGIDPGDLPHIFNRFHQGNRERRLTYGGAGLGLFICKQLVEALSGTIEVQSEPGRGSAFTVALPLRRIPPKDHPPGGDAPQNTQRDGLRALIVEDNLMNRRYLEGVMNMWKYRFVSAQNGAEALDLLSKEVFDLIFMDIRMPVMDGYEASRRLRSLTGNPNQHIPIIALTASALLDEKEKALNAGMNAHLSKPYTPEQLQAAIQRVMPVAATQAGPACEGSWPLVEGIDTDRLNLLYGEDREHALLMVDMFLDMIPPEAETILVHAQAGNAPDTASAIHKIKPSLGMVGLTSLEKDAAVLDRSLPALVAEGADILALTSEFIEKVRGGIGKVARLQAALRPPETQPPAEAALQNEPGQTSVALPLVGEALDHFALEWLREGKPLLGPEGLMQKVSFLTASPQ